MRAKFEIYEEFGVKEYWIVNPHEEHVIVYVLNQEGKFEGLRLSPTLFPDLEINMEELFAQ